MLQATGAAGIAGLIRPAAASAADATPLTLVSDGQATAVVITPLAQSAQVTNAVNELLDCVEEATGVRLPVQAQSPSAPVLPDAPTVGIFVGLIAPGIWNDVTSQLSDLDDDGHVIQPNANSITIIGPSPWGTQFGIYEFLERYLGVRWLMPGAAGRDVPASSGNLTITAEHTRDEPAFLMRTYSPLFNAGHTDTSGDADPVNQWAAHARAHWRVEFHHNLYQLISVSRFGQSNPEFFPIHDGETFIPPASQTTYWQPRFGAPGIVDAAVSVISDYLSTHPTHQTYSLGVNDDGGFSEDEVDLAKLNSVGYADASVPYYTFVNAVAEQIAERFPTATLGVLAYTNVADPPPFALSPNVVVFLTRDRYGWVDDEVRQADQATTSAWLEVASEVGWYDYRYGTPYCVPRADTQIIAPAYRWAHDNGVRWSYCEIYPNWGEGAKPWLYSKLVWNPDSDLDALTDEWHARAVGAAAAGPLKDYYRLWQGLWEKQIPKSPWFREPRMYYYFVDASYLSQVSTSQVAKARTLIESVIARAQSPTQQARAQVLMSEFEYYEASALSYPRQTAPPSSAADAVALLAGIVDTLDANIGYAAKRLDLRTQYRSNPVLNLRLALEDYKVAWTGWNLYPLWDVADFVRSHEPHGGPVTHYLQRMAMGRNSADVQRYAQLTLAAAAGQQVERIANGSFDDGTDSWQISYAWKTAETASISTEVSYEGGSSLRLPAGFQGDVIQRVAVTPGPVRVRARLRAESADRPAGYYVVAQCQLLDAGGAITRQIWSPWAAVRDCVDTWEAIVATDVIPDGVSAANIVLDMQLNTALYVDEVEVTQISE
jgi:hypothetical protein